MELVNQGLALSHAAIHGLVAVDFVAAAEKEGFGEGEPVIRFLHTKSNVGPNVLKGALFLVRQADK